MVDHKNYNPLKRKKNPSMEHIMIILISIGIRVDNMPTEVLFKKSTVCVFIN